MTPRTFILAVGLVLMTSVLCACFGSDSEGELLPVDPPGSPTVPFADTEDQLMANFQTIYQDMDFNLFKNLLRTDYLMYLQARTQVDFPDVGATMDRAEELRSAVRMFDGVEMTDAHGQYLAPMETIEFAIIEQATAWSSTLPNDVFPNARTAVFDVNFYFSRSNGAFLETKGQIRFYVAKRDSLHNGANRNYWEMIGQMDMTGNQMKAIEETSWGSMKALYY